ncbi:MAG: IS1634 family transposase [Candidatus Lokiarchaeota archaeon]|nr:IS1634 family transposase [Candidatus Lokiarchaeota archaeon]
MVFVFEKRVKKKHKTYKYLYLGHNKRVNGKSKRIWETLLCRKDQVEENLQEIKRKLSQKPPEAVERAFGLVYGLFSTCREIGLVDIINECTIKRGQGFSVGEYISLLAINRAVALNSKSQVRTWFDKTALKRQFPGISKFLTTQNILNQMGYLDREVIRCIEAKVCKKIYSEFGLESDCFLFDPTNFFTYIREYKKNTLAQRGNNKKKRRDLRQVSMSLLVTRGECNLPLMHETYGGSVPDVSHFKEALTLMEGRFNAIGLDFPKITLVFDKGNNSKGAYKFLDAKGIHFVSSIRPSMKVSKPLLEVPLANYEVLWTKENGKKVLGYRTTTTVYLGKGKQNTLIITFDEDTFSLQEYALDKKVYKALLKLEEFVKDKLNTKPQWKDAKKVVTKIERDILKNKKLRAIILYSIGKEGNGLKITWKIDSAARDEYLRLLGKTLIFSSRNEWSTVDIVKTYRAQIDVERQFKELNKRERLSIMPMYVWTDKMIRAHFFISVLALLLSNLLYRKITLAGIAASKDKCLEALEEIKEIHLNYGDDHTPEVLLTKMSALQRTLFKVLDLKQFKGT